MLESLYTEAIRKKGKIADKIEKYEDHNLNISKFWNDEIIPKSTDNLTIAAGDGSISKKKFLSFNFYAIAAESLIYNSKLEKIESSKIDTIEHHNFANDRLRNYMGLFEIKSAIKSINDFEIDYYFYDGSILGDLIRPFPFENEIPHNFRKEITNFGEKGLKKEIDDKNKKVEISSFKVANEFLKLNKYYEFNKNYELDIYLENLEKLLAIANLLKYPKKIIAISKTSTANDYFEKNIPDIAIFDKNIRDEGFSTPFYKDVSSRMKHNFPVEDDFFRTLTFTIFYARLEDKKNILKFELPYKATIDEIKEIIAISKSNATEGYPYLLKKAHHDVVIKNNDMESLSKIVGFYEKSGREML